MDSQNYDFFENLYLKVLFSEEVNILHFVVNFQGVFLLGDLIDRQPDSGVRPHSKELSDLIISQIRVIVDPSCLRGCQRLPFRDVFQLLDSFLPKISNL